MNPNYANSALGLQQGSYQDALSAQVGVASRISATPTGLPSSRSLASALDRLIAIAASLESANDRTTQFLDALVGPDQVGQAYGAGAPDLVPSYVNQLHSAIDRLERSTDVASRKSYALLDAAADNKERHTNADVGR